MQTENSSTLNTDRFGPLPGNTRGELFVIGHSHVGCVQGAANDYGEQDLYPLNFWGLPGAIEYHDGEAYLAEEIAARIADYWGPVFSMLGGSTHAVLGLLVHARRYDFVLPDQPDLSLDPEAELVPALAMRRIMASRMAEYLALMEQVHAHSRGNMVHIEPPPPSADVERLVFDIHWSMSTDAQYEVSPLVLRYKLWRLESRILRDWCAERNVAFIQCPQACLDEQGCLADDYYGDGAHANAAYGWQVLQQMRQRL